MGRDAQRHGGTHSVPADGDWSHTPGGTLDLERSGLLVRVRDALPPGKFVSLIARFEDGEAIPAVTRAGRDAEGPVAGLTAVVLKRKGWIGHTWNVEQGRFEPGRSVGDLRAWRALARRLGKAGPLPPRVDLALRRAEAAVGPTGPVAASELTDLALKLLSAQAAELGRIDDRLLLAEFHEREGRFEAAIELLQSVRDEVGGSVELDLKLASALAYAGRREQALHMLQAPLEAGNQATLMLCTQIVGSDPAACGP
ncbi:MAG: hypothetical protein GY898_21265 [Proteobacteria bacterium]|nr:hypothetical protein [Pseudomonadota bacterium]